MRNQVQPGYVAAPKRRSDSSSAAMPSLNCPRRSKHDAACLERQGAQRLTAELSFRVSLRQRPIVNDGLLPVDPHAAGYRRSTDESRARAGCRAPDGCIHRACRGGRRRIRATQTMNDRRRFLPELDEAVIASSVGRGKSPSGGASSDLFMASSSASPVRLRVGLMDRIFKRPVL